MPRSQRQRAAIGNFLQEHFPLLVAERHLQRTPPGLYLHDRGDFSIGDHSLSLFDFDFDRSLLLRKEGNAALLQITEQPRADSQAVSHPRFYLYRLAILAEQQGIPLFLKKIHSFLPPIFIFLAFLCHFTIYLKELPLFPEHFDNNSE